MDKSAPRPAAYRKQLPSSSRPRARRPSRWSSFDASSHVVVWMLTVDYGIDQNAAVADLDADLVAGLKEFVLRSAHARRTAGRDHVARPQGDMAAEIGDLLGERIDHVLRAAVLPQLAVDPEFDAHGVRIGHELGRRQPRPHWHRVAEAFLAEPVMRVLVRQRLAPGVI